MELQVHNACFFQRENFGTNPDHARNSLTNCGIRQPEYGDRRIHYMNTRKRGPYFIHQTFKDFLLVFLPA